jgi:hypothetical protein
MADETGLFRPEEWEQHCHNVTRRMTDSVSSFSTPISISLNDDRTGKHLGTGSFHDLAGIKLLLSCEHVLTARSKSRLAHRLLGFDRYILIDGPGGSAPAPIDAAVALIPQAVWDGPQHRSQAVPLNRVAVVHDPVPSELFFVHGFAFENSQFIYDELRTDGTAYLCSETPLPENPQLNLQFHFALEYRKDVATRAFGDRGLPNPRGMSGSLVWNTRFVECALAKKD